MMPMLGVRTFNLMNTTQRILANDRTPEGCRAFLLEVHKNNPTCAKHWERCLTNNPGGYVPALNPTEWEQMLDLGIAMVA